MLILCPAKVMALFFKFKEKNSVEEMIGSVVDSFLGSNKSNKLVVEDNETHLVKCPLILFQHTHLKDPLSHLIEETLYAHHERYGCSIITLLAMWYFWNKEFERAIDDGCEVSDIITISQRSLEHVISLLHLIEVSTDNIFSFVKEDLLKLSSTALVRENAEVKKTVIISKTKALEPSSKKSLKSLVTIPQGVMYSSRHYSPFQNNFQNSDGDIVGNSDICKVSGLNKPSELDKNFNINLSKEVVDGIHCLIRRLSHDDAKSANIVSKVWIQQIISRNSIQFTTDGIIVCPITMNSTFTTVVDGLIIKTNANKFCSQGLDKVPESNMLIIKGDVRYDYVHLGFAPNVSIQSKNNAEDLSISEKDIWLKECFELLLRLKINILLVKGNADPAILSFCFLHSILLVTSVKWTTLKILCKAMNAIPAVYLTECDSKNIISGVSVKQFQMDIPLSLKNDDCYLQIQVKQPGNLHTVILCHPSPMVLDLEEHQFWHLASKLSFSMESSAVLPGEGCTERWCNKILEDLAVSKENNESRILRAVANGFFAFSNAVAKKRELGGQDDHEITLDEMKSKVQAWRSAISLVLTTIQCDLVLINGCDEAIFKDTKLSEEFLGLL